MTTCQQHVRHARSITDGLSFLLFKGNASGFGNSPLYGAAPENEAMHLLLWKAAQEIRNMLVGNLFYLSDALLFILESHMDLLLPIRDGAPTSGMSLENPNYPKH